MILGHAAGVVAALTVKAGAEAHVQDVSPTAVASVLLADGQLLSPTPPTISYGCENSDEGKRCLIGTGTSHHGNSTTCGGECTPMQPREWLALKAHYYPPKSDANILQSRYSTVLKKSVLISGSLPEWAKQSVGVAGENSSVILHLSCPPRPFNADYWLVDCAQENCSTAVEAAATLLRGP